MPVRMTPTVVSRRFSSMILARRSPVGAWCLWSYQVSPFRATRACRRDTAHAATKRKTTVRALSICYNLSLNRRYRQGSRCHKPRSESLPRLNLMTPVELLQHLIRFDTTNPPGNEAECVEFVRSLLEEAGVESRLYAKDPARPNLVARVSGTGGSRPLLLQGDVEGVATRGV